MGRTLDDAIYNMSIPRLSWQSRLAIGDLGINLAMSSLGTFHFHLLIASPFQPPSASFDLA